MIERKDFIDLYKPVINPFSKDKCSFIYKFTDQLYDQFKDFALNKRAWSLVEKYNAFILIPGFIRGDFVFGYAFTENPWENNRIEVAYSMSNENNSD